ncbi:Domain of unknown function DUF1786 putative pyruvate format-lyase activating enzyme [Methanosalsum zhilinae DSM 4017]|uniref:Pyruvate formate-lyase activating enzyme n=1 Tax=Methanosalsum zhilinae (strain DSM 4017 / NBRC 107636 / OCM 62 / WeN5) TaxID=679901 RepID=F7XMD2_METZD|nr:DUF1786 domain-containing protein [Methanosalsum zhilinae]AEH61662.1 Domain of unknown function DUF1786 putative pyruvate format-lyase activating enzyme [Methanosalsum zhilinae DSM 4017]
MQILAIDIGTGTQDILIYDTEKEPENNYHMVMPSPTSIIAGRIRKATYSGSNILLTGDIMGGGPCVRAIRDHIHSGFCVYAEEKAALTINDNIEKVKSLGIRIIRNVNEISKNDKPFERIKMGDIDPDIFKRSFSSFDLIVPDRICVALQDHGNSPHSSNRKARFRYLEDTINKGGTIDCFTYEYHDIPEDLTRMKAASKALSRFDTVFMDTGPAAIFGAMEDSRAVQPCIVVNVGNGHTLAAVVSDDRIVGLFEHHTSAIDWHNFQKYIIKLGDGSLTFEEIFNEGGHGCYTIENIGIESIRSVLVTGPNRNRVENIPLLSQGFRGEVIFAAPAGNMMLSGCYGLVAGHLQKKK